MGTSKGVIFEDNPSKYGLKFFILDIFILITLFGAFHSLWVVKSDSYFFVTVILLIIWFVVWNWFAGEFNIKEIFSKVLITIMIICMIPLATSFLKGFDTLFAFES